MYSLRNHNKLDVLEDFVDINYFQCPVVSDLRRGEDGGAGRGEDGGAGPDVDPINTITINYLNQNSPGA